VTADAELQEKSAADVKRMVELVLSQSLQAVREHDDKNNKELTTSQTTATQQSSQAATTERMLNDWVGS